MGEVLHTDITRRDFLKNAVNIGLRLCASSALLSTLCLLDERADKSPELSRLHVAIERRNAFFDLAYAQNSRRHVHEHIASLEQIESNLVYPEVQGLCEAWVVHGANNKKDIDSIEGLMALKDLIQPDESRPLVIVIEVDISKLGDHIVLYHPGDWSRDLMIYDAWLEKVIQLQEKHSSEVVIVLKHDCKNPQVVEHCVDRLSQVDRDIFRLSHIFNFDGGGSIDPEQFIDQCNYLGKGAWMLSLGWSYDPRHFYYSSDIKNNMQSIADLHPGHTTYALEVARMVNSDPELLTELIAEDNKTITAYMSRGSPPLSMEQAKWLAHNTIPEKTIFDLRWI